MNLDAQLVSYDLTDRNTTSNFVLAADTSPRCRAAGRTVNSPSWDLTVSPASLIRSMLAGHRSMSVTSRPPRARYPPITPPIAPAPSTAIFIRYLSCVVSIRPG